MDAKPQVLAYSGNRIIYLDLLRIISAFAVVMLHVSAQNWEDSFFSIEWMIRNVYDSCVRWCVPVFVMISGALFLDSSRELHTKQLYKKSILHIFNVFIIWSIIYALMNIKNYPNINSFIADIIAGKFHLWFLKMLLGLYIAIPILRVIVSNKQTEKYFIYLSVITCFVLPLFLFSIGFFNNEIKVMVERWYNTMNIKIALGYTGYFVLGHYLNNYTFNTKLKNILFVSGILSIICVIILTYFYSVHLLGETSEYFMEYLTPFTLLEAIAIFLFIKQVSCTIPIKFHKSIIHLSKMTFGIYLVHILVLLDIIHLKLGIDSSTFNPAFFIPCLSIIVFLMSYIITRILYNIPYLNKLMI